MTLFGFTLTGLTKENNVTGSTSRTSDSFSTRRTGTPSTSSQFLTVLTLTFISLATSVMPLTAINGPNLLPGLGISLRITCLRDFLHDLVAVQSCQIFYNYYTADSQPPTTTGYPVFSAHKSVLGS